MSPASKITNLQRVGRSVESALVVAMDSQQHLLGIETQLSGKCALVCPFCKGALIAVRGQSFMHHFRHEGDTCREAKKSLPSIPGWDHFHLSLPRDLFQEISSQEGREYFPHRNIKAGKLERYELIERNGFTRHLELTDLAMVVCGRLTLAKFGPWFRARLSERIQQKREAVARGEMHPAHLAIEARRQQEILSSTLYLLEFEGADGKTFHKVGRTNRSPAERLIEVVGDLAAKHQLQVTGKVLRAIPNAGYIERFTHWKHRTVKLDLGVYRVFLVLDQLLLRTLKAELTRFENTWEPFSDEERLIVGGAWPNTPQRDHR